MSVQDCKRQFPAVIDRVEDEAALRELLETANRALGSRDILDDLTEEQRIALMEAREQGRQGDYITLDKYKKGMEQKWRSRGLS